MPFNLPRLARQQGIRSAKTLRPIVATQAQVNALARIIAQVATVWQNAIPRIMAGYDPAPIGDALTKDAPADITAALNATDSEIERLMILISAQLRSWSVGIERWHRRKWASAVQAATTVDLSTILTGQETQETLSVWLDRQVALVRDVSAQARGKIADAVYRGYQARTPVREVAKEVREATGFARDRSIRIAADQAKKLAGALDVERQVEAGLTIFRYRHGGKLHYRPWHKARDGKLFYLKSGKEVDGPDVIKPGDGPTEPPFCSCIRQAYVPLLDEFGL